MLEGLQVQQGLLGRRRPPPLGLRQDWGIWLVKRRRWLWCDRPRVTCKLRAGTLKLHGEEAGAGGGDKPLQLPAFPGCLRTRAWLWGFSFWTVDTQCEFQGHRAVTQCLKVTMYINLKVNYKVLALFHVLYNTSCAYFTLAGLYLLSPPCHAPPCSPPTGNHYLVLPVSVSLFPFCYIP